ncbi:MAG TPA: AraC family transcriptional regulator [Candidatus Angelobacter sp.]|nr:AraC family transcriptional regulator [Candidatus Angelobacter sp.]
MLQDSAVSFFSFQPSPRVARELESDPRLLLALRFIDRNYGRASIGLRDISQSAGLSMWHFSRLFNAHMGMGLRDYLKNIRLKHARTLLRSSALSIKEIAADVGYTHLSDFYHHFKAEYGIPPLLFRRGAQRNDVAMEMSYVGGEDDCRKGKPVQGVYGENNAQ